MDSAWEGTFEIWQNPVFSEIYTKCTGRERVSIDGIQGFVTHRPVLGYTTLYIYNLQQATEKNVREIISLSKKRRVARIWIYSPEEIPAWDNLCMPTYTLIMDLALSEERLWKMIGAKTRNMVRRGDKEGVKIELATTERQFSNWWRAYIKTAYDKGFSPQPYELVHTLFEQASLSKLLIATKDFRVIGGMFFLVNKYPMYWLGALDRSYKHYHGANLNMWNAILYFKDKGYKILDFGGIEMDESHGPSRFKRSFNGEVRKAWIYEIPIQKPKAFLLASLSSIRKVGERLKTKHMKSTKVKTGDFAKK